MDENIKIRLKQIADSNGGRITPELVVGDAADPDSPLHDRFEWDDSAAAQSWRLEQARTLIRSVKIVSSTSTSRVVTVAYVRDPSLPPEQQGYVEVSKLRTDTDLAREALIAEFARVSVALRRARDLAVALGLEGQIDELQLSVARLRDAAETRVAA